MKITKSMLCPTDLGGASDFNIPGACCWGNMNLRKEGCSDLGSKLVAEK